MDLGFLKTKQKNTNITFSNFDFNHSNGYTSQLGQMLVSQCTKVLPNDKIKHRVNEETLLKALENPSFTKFKHVHKSFYYPNTVLWKYWDNFLTNKPDDLWTNSDITSYINERQPYSIPKCYFADLLPILACAYGYACGMELGCYLPQLPYIVNTLIKYMAEPPSSEYANFWLQFWPPYMPFLLGSNGQFDGPNTYKNAVLDNFVTSRPYSTLFYLTDNDHELAECGFYNSKGQFNDLHNRDWNSSDIFENISSFNEFVKAQINANRNIPSDLKSKLLSLCEFDSYRFFVRFKINSTPWCNVNFTHLYANNSEYDPTIDPIYDKTDFRNLIALDTNGIQLGMPVNDNVDNRSFTINNHYSEGLNGSDVECPYWILPLPSAVESTSFGFTPLAFFFYNCKNIAKHLDMMGVTIPKDFINFSRDDLFQPINLMPFMAYNRFYHEEIADKQRQVNCPNWSAANGLIATRFCATEKQNSSLEKYQTIGWTLHFEDIPYNKQYNLQDIKITTYNPFSAAMLLMGFDINLLCTNQSFSDLTELCMSYAKSPCVVSFLEPVFQCYNGLLHLQYANFAPDYFNQSVMDPLAGAQDIQIPSTITQLQEKSKLQELLNQTAWTRNIKEFLQSQFDSFSKYTTIDDPVITGSCDVDVNISQVLQTSESTDGNPLGKRAGVGSAYGNGWLCDNEFHEFGYYMTVSYFVMDSVYIDRLDKSVIAEDNYLELPFPQLANLGNEAIKMHEVQFGKSKNFTSNQLTPLAIAPYIHSYAAVFNGEDSTMITKPGTATPRNPHTNQTIDNKPLPDMLGSGQVTPSNVNFGYIPRFSSYKFKFDQVHGEFLTTLKNWVNSRELQIMPLQTYTFISYECQAQLSNLTKNFVDKDQLSSDCFMTNSYNIMSVRRCLPFVVNPQM